MRDNWSERFDEEFLMNNGMPKELAYKGGYHAVKSFITKELERQRAEEREVVLSFLQMYKYPCSKHDKDTRAENYVLNELIDELSEHIKNDDIVYESQRGTLDQLDKGER